MSYLDTGKYNTVIMHALADRFASVRERIRKTEQQISKPAGSVRLLAVSKTKPVEVIQAAYELGQIDFAENYLQDAIPKIISLRYLPLQWHFIGRVQSNKTRQVASLFDWVHSIDRIKIAQRLNDQRPDDLNPINVCLQVMLDNEPNKSGVHPDLLHDLAFGVSELPNLNLRGLMLIPKPCTDKIKQRESFKKINDILQMLVRDTGLKLDTLSMGMSDDFELAIEEGATIVRIGTALFGERNKA